ncbi:hypothetical protein ACJRO7_032932 [Eucalyptus globulus]|uniref:Uncharacterized protein n=1 Tax=Eucalyptus globulus TaxID=34317 RepID=A0ABD3JL64_EUCGL
MATGGWRYPILESSLAEANPSPAKMFGDKRLPVVSMSLFSSSLLVKKAPKSKSSSLLFLPDRHSILLCSSTIFYMNLSLFSYNAIILFSEEFTPSASASNRHQCSR